MSGPEMPLWEIGKKAADGRTYVDLEAATYIVGIIGLNECLQYMIGKELHEGDDVVKLGLRIISHMYFKVKEEGEKYNLKFSLEESPAEGASRRLAKIDVRNYEEAVNLIKGDIDKDEFYYTNSVHLRPDAPTDMITRINVQSKFHSMIESGAIIHAFVGEERPPASGIMKLVRKTFENTQAAQLTISPEFTICNECHRVIPRLVDVCSYCDSSNFYGIRRLVSHDKVNNWDRTRISELVSRHKENSKT
jgi:ribonucleoside-triphosphate reductase